MNTGAAASGFRPNIRKILITLDGNGKPQLADGDETIIISPLNNDEVIWESAEQFVINFKGASPFYEGQFSNKYAQSGLIRRDVISSKSVFYEYTIIINGQTLDPRFIVDP